MNREATTLGPVLSVRDLSVALPEGADRKFAVRAVSFDVHAGQTVCLLGESGSGKSVIAQTVMGLLPASLRPTAGTVRLRDEELIGLTGNRLRSLRGAVMSMVFQEPMTALNPVMTCGDQVDEVLRQHTDLPPAQRRQRVLEVFDRVRLPEPARIYASFPHQLSGGQRQRIVIAIAVMLQPALLICDEPTTALDVTTQAEILALIKDLQQQNGTAVLFITHDFGVVADIADDVVVLQLGEMVEQGSKSAVLQRPAQEYTKQLLAAVPGLIPQPRIARRQTELLLEARAICKRYEAGTWPKKCRVVDAAAGVSFSVHAGETIGIVGESGSGKSTVARCVARLIEPTGGEVIALGNDMARVEGPSLSLLRRHVQIVFQDPYRSLNPRRTVGNSIIEGPVNFGVPPQKAWKHAEELMRLVRLPAEALHRYPSEFSGGQRQRICVARALACEPRVLIADEAVSALDVSVQAQVLALLKEIQERLQIGILFITHDLRVASQICDRVIVMRSGVVVEEGAASDVLSAPKHAYTKNLVASVPGRAFHFGAAASH